MADDQQQLSPNDPWAARAKQLEASAPPGAAAQLDQNDPWAARSRQLQGDTTAAQPQQPSDPWAARAAQLSGSQQAQGGNDESERMGEGQSMLTRPLSTYLGIPEYREGAGGVEKGLEKFASGLTSPLNIGLMLVTGGVGGLAEAGAEAAGEGVASGLAGSAGRALLSRLAPETAAAVGKAASTVSKLANMGFTANQIIDVTKAVPRIGDAIRAGDTDTAAEMITTAALGTITAGLSTAHLLRGTPGSPVIEHDKEIIGKAQQQERSFNQRAEKFEHDHLDLIKDKPTDMAGMLYHEAGGRAGETAPPVDESDESELGLEDKTRAPRKTTYPHPDADKIQAMADKARAEILPAIADKDAAWKAYRDHLQSLEPRKLWDPKLDQEESDRSQELWKDYADKAENVENIKRAMVGETRVGVISPQPKGRTVTYLSNDAI